MSIGLLIDIFVPTAMYNLGTVMISNVVPDPSGYPPSTSNSCTSERCEGLVWIYYGDAKHLRQWGTINREGSTRKSRDTLCNQMGYIRSIDYSLDPTRGNDSYPVWLTEVACDHRLCQQGESCYNHEYDLVIECGEYA